MPNHDHQEPHSEQAQNVPTRLNDEAALNAYLDTICKQVLPQVPRSAIEEMRLEMQGHLLAAVSAHREMGFPQDQALARTLAQFGKPEVVARKWSQEWEKTLAETKGAPFWPSLRRAMGVWSLAYGSLLGLGEVIRHFPTMPDVMRVQLTMMGVFGIPVIAGAVVGLVARRKPVVSNAVASISVLPLYLLIIMLQLNAIAPDGWKSSLWFAVNPFLIWLPLSSISTTITAQIRKFGNRRMTAR